MIHKFSRKFTYITLSGSIIAFIIAAIFTVIHNRIGAQLSLLALILIVHTFAHNFGPYYSNSMKLNEGKRQKDFAKDFAIRLILGIVEYITVLLCIVGGYAIVGNIVSENLNIEKDSIICTSISIAYVIIVVILHEVRSSKWREEPLKYDKEENEE